MGSITSLMGRRRDGKQRKAGWLVSGPLRHEEHFQQGLPQFVHTALVKDGRYKMLEDPTRDALAGLVMLPHWETSLAARLLVARALAAELPILAAQIGADAEGNIVSLDLNPMNRETLAEIVKQDVEQEKVDAN